jgi:hypothetical protein
LTLSVSSPWRGNVKYSLVITGSVTIWSLMLIGVENYTGRSSKVH